MSMERDEPFDRSLASPLEALAALRSLGEDSVVATGRATARQQAMYVATELDDALVEFTKKSEGLRLVVLSGSAGGGKSALIQRLCQALPGVFQNIIEDATHAESPSEDQTRTLAAKLSGFRAGLPGPDDRTVIAANTGLLLELDKEFRGSGDALLADVTAFVLSKLGVPAAPPVDTARREELSSAVLVVDLDQRPTSGGDGRLFRQMLASLEPDLLTGVLGGAARCRTCKVREWCAPRTNAELLADPRVGAALDEAVEQVAFRRGRDIAPRHLWDLIGELALGGGLPPAGDPCDAVAALAAAENAREVWRRLLPNGVFEAPQSDLARDLADLDPSYQPDAAAHEIIASAGISLQDDADLLRESLALPSPARAAIATASRALAGEKDLERARGLARARWLVGGIQLKAEIPPGFRAAIREDNSEDAWAALEMVSHGLSRTFGVSADGYSYLPTESPGETQDFQVLVQMDLGNDVAFRMARPRAANKDGSQVVGLRPLTCLLKIGRSTLEFDLALYQLLEASATGAVATTIDIERFHALRYAAERLGREAAEDPSRALLITNSSKTTYYRVTARPWGDGEQLRVERVA
jgi:hypothetical protein